MWKYWSRNWRYCHIRRMLVLGGNALLTFFRSAALAMDYKFTLAPEMGSRLSFSAWCWVTRVPLVLSKVGIFGADAWCLWILFREWTTHSLYHLWCNTLGLLWMSRRWNLFQKRSRSMAALTAYVSPSSFLWFLHVQPVNSCGLRPFAFVFENMGFCFKTLFATFLQCTFDLFYSACCWFLLVETQSVRWNDSQHSPVQATESAHDDAILGLWFACRGNG